MSGAPVCVCTLGVAVGTMQLEQTLWGGGRLSHVHRPTSDALVCRYYVDDPSKGTAPGVVTEQGDKQIAGKLELLKVGAVDRAGRVLRVWAVLP